MYNIAVLSYDLINNYNYTVIDGIYNYFKDKSDVRLIAAPVNAPHSDNGFYDYQYWSLTKILKSEQIDGIILVSNSFVNHIDFDSLTEELKIFTNKPVVSIARKIELPDSKYTCNTCDKAYEQIIEHIKNKHNKTRIAFFDGELIDSTESKLRFQAFKNALKKNNLEFNPELVFHGDFTPGTAKQVLSEKIKSKADLNFDAICCVNDYTCGGCLLVFNELGIKSPEDVIIFGYDDCEFSRQTYPTLSSINQSVYNIAEKSAEMLYKTLKKEFTEEVLYTDSFPVYRQSCGCVSNATYTSAYYDWQGNYFEKNEKDKNEEISFVKRYQDELVKIYGMINLVDCKISMDNVLEALRPAMIMSDISALMVGFYDAPLIIEKNDDIKLPENVEIRIAIDVENERYDIFPLKQGIQVNLEKRFAPDMYESYKSGQYFVFPLFKRNKNYGYLLCRSNNSNYILTSINLKIISDILVSAYEYSMVLRHQEKLVENTMNLSISVKTDELTQIFNRRGILEYGQQIIDLSLAMNKSGSVFFCDLDGLKKINDTYGHKIGDLAIKTEAAVLKACFREADIIGRLSGDEFCAIAPGFPSNRIDVLRKKLLENNEKFSREAGLPFTLSMSVGAVSFGEESADLQTLLQLADQQLYEEKKIKHAKDNK